MQATIENPTETAHVRLYVSGDSHQRVKEVRRLLEKKNKSDVKLSEVYLKAIDLGLQQLEKEVA